MPIWKAVIPCMSTRAPFTSLQGHKCKLVSQRGCANAVWTSTVADLSLAPPRCALTTPHRDGKGMEVAGYCTMPLEGSKVSELWAGAGCPGSHGVQGGTWVHPGISTSSRLHNQVSRAQRVSLGQKGHRLVATPLDGLMATNLSHQPHADLPGKIFALESDLKGTRRSNTSI